MTDVSTSNSPPCISPDVTINNEQAEKPAPRTMSCDGINGVTGPYHRALANALCAYKACTSVSYTFLTFSDTFALPRLPNRRPVSNVDAFFFACPLGPHRCGPVIQCCMYAREITQGAQPCRQHINATTHKLKRQSNVDPSGSDIIVTPQSSSSPTHASGTSPAVSAHQIPSTHSSMVTTAHNASIQEPCTQANLAMIRPSPVANQFTPKTIFLSSGSNPSKPLTDVLHPALLSTPFSSQAIDGYRFQPVLATETPRLLSAAEEACERNISCTVWLAVSQ